MHVAFYHPYRVTLSKRYAGSDAMSASVLIGINPCTSFAAGQALPFCMNHFCIAAACATNGDHPFEAFLPSMQKHQPTLQY